MVNVVVADVSWIFHLSFMSETLCMHVCHSAEESMMIVQRMTEVIAFLLRDLMSMKP
jgi:hypothetical protein